MSKVEYLWNGGVKKDEVNSVLMIGLTLNTHIDFAFSPLLTRGKRMKNYIL